MDDFGELFGSLLMFSAMVLVIVALGAAILFVGASVLVAGVPIGLGYWWYHATYLSAEARERDAKERTWTLYRAVKSTVDEVDIASALYRELPDLDEHTIGVLMQIGASIAHLEGLENFPPEPPELCDTIEGARYRDFLNSLSAEAYNHRLKRLYEFVPLCALPHTKETVAKICGELARDDAFGSPFPKTWDAFARNWDELKEVHPLDYEGDDIIHDFFKNTPMALMAQIFHDDSVSIPDHLRNQHHMILGGTGHGKTQCLQEMILRDLEDEDACVIVIDSQQGMLERLLRVVSWDRVMYLDAGNIAQPLALSAFSIGQTTRPEDEPRVRMATALYEHMFASRETKFTTKQQTLYRFLSRFLFVIPDANFDTALDILENGFEPYDAHVAQLTETEQSFIRGNLDNPKAKGASQGYKQTRQEVAQRLYTLLESSTIRRMFSAPENRVNIPKAIRDDRIILINTAQQTLGLEGATLFGRYCIAQIAMEVLNRPETTKRVYFYIDEAQEYLSGDPIIHRLFEQGRKRGLCMICAFHRLGQIGEDLADMMRSLTSIKFAGGISNADATKLAKEMKTDAETITEQPPLSFWAWFKGEEPGVYRVTPQVLEKEIADLPDDVNTIKGVMSDLYHYDPEEGSAEYDAEPEDEPPEDPGADEFGDYYADDWNSEDTPKRQPSEEDDIDPDAPQNLDWSYFDSA